MKVPKGTLGLAQNNRFKTYFGISLTNIKVFDKTFGWLYIKVAKNIAGLAKIYPAFKYMLA